MVGATHITDMDMDTAMATHPMVMVIHTMVTAVITTTMFPTIEEEEIQITAEVTEAKLEAGLIMFQPEILHTAVLKQHAA